MKKSQLIFQFKQLERRSLKKIRASMGFEPVTSVIPVIYRFFHHLASEHNFWNRSTFLKKHHISSRSWKESFSRNSVKISDCWACSPF